MASNPSPFARFAKQWAVLVTTWRRDGTPVGSAVNPAVEGDFLYFRTYASSGKAKRLRNNAHLEIAPCTPSGKTTGPATAGTARLLAGDEALHAAALIRKKHPVFHGVLVPVAHKLRRYQTVHYEVTAVNMGDAGG